MRWLVDDVRLAARMLAKNRGFALASVLTLVLGIVLNTAVFSIANAIVLRPLPFRAGGDLVHISSTHPEQGLHAGLSQGDLSEVTDRRDLLEDAACFSEKHFNLTVDGAPSRVWGGVMSHNALALLGIRTILGRGFTREEQESGTAVVLIGELFWKTRLAADPRAIGRQVRLDGKPATIIGVLPRDFRFIYTDYDVIVPLPLDAARGERSLDVLARLQPNVGLEAARQSLASTATTASAWRLSVAPYRHLFERSRRDAAVLLAASALLLLIVCANVSNLFLAKVASRRRDIAIRIALGSGTGRIVRQLLVEGMLIGLLGGVLSAVFSLWLQHILVAGFPQLWMFVIGYRVLAFALLLSLTSGVVFGLAPALSLCRTQINGVLKSTAGAVSGGSGQRLRKTLVVSELALGVMLVAATGMLLTSIVQKKLVDAGFDSENLLIGEVALEGSTYATAEQRVRFARSIRDGLSSIEGIQADVADFTPLASGATMQAVAIDGGAAANVQIAVHGAGPRVLDVLGVRLLAGRKLTDADRNSVIVNERFVHHFWRQSPSVADAIGRRLRIGDDRAWLTVVGVMPDARQSLGDPPYPEVMRSYADAPGSGLKLVVRTNMPYVAAASLLRREAQAIDPDLPVNGPSRMSDLIENFFPMPVLYGIGTFAGVALLLSIIGLYGVTSHLVVQRTTEIGVRIALGATRNEVFRIVLGDAIRLAATGAALGIAGTMAVSRVLAHYLEGVSSTDPAVLAAVAATLVIVAITAGAAPALRACRVDPIVALRHQ